MNRWDHLDVVVTVGICATILGAGIFFFAFGGAPSGITERFVEPAPAVIDQEGVARIAFDEALGRIVAQMAEKERNAVLRRQEALGWTVVGRLLMLEQLSGHTQERLGSAVRDAGVLSAMVERETPLAQESLGSAILVASAAQSAVSTGNVPSIPVALTPGVAGIQALREIPYPAGVLLFAALFMIVWGVRCVAESGPPLPTYSTSDTAQELYRKAG